MPRRGRLIDLIIQSIGSRMARSHGMSMEGGGGRCSEILILAVFLLVLCTAAVIDSSSASSRTFCSLSVTRQKIPLSHQQSDTGLPAPPPTCPSIFDPPISLCTTPLDALLRTQTPATGPARQAKGINSEGEEAIVTTSMAGQTTAVSPAESETVRAPRSQLPARTSCDSIRSVLADSKPIMHLYRKRMARSRASSTWRHLGSY